MRARAEATQQRTTFFLLVSQRHLDTRKRATQTNNISTCRGHKRVGLEEAAHPARRFLTAKLVLPEGLKGGIKRGKL